MNIDYHDPKAEADGWRLLWKDLYDEVMSGPFGSLSKTELEQILFSSFAKSGHIDLGQSDFEVAKQLRCKPSKIAGMRYVNHLRAARDQVYSPHDLAQHVQLVADKEATNHKRTTFYVSEKFWREQLAERAAEVGVFTDTSFNQARVIVGTDTFLENAGPIFGPENDIAPEVERLRKRLRVKGRAEAFGMVMAKAVAPVAVSSLGAFLKQFVVA